MQCPNKGLWYSNNIGCLFIATEYSPGYYAQVLIDPKNGALIETFKTIRKSDCMVIDINQEPVPWQKAKSAMEILFPCTHSRSI
jgi:hypothetical protein